MNSSAVRIVNRAANVAGSYGTARVAPDRVDSLALAKLVVEHARQEITLFIHFVYERDARGRLTHVLPDGQIAPKHWTPWGASGKASLPRTQRDTLRAWLVMQAQQRRYAPFFYRSATRRWYLDLLRFDEKADALQWLERCGLDAKTWVGVADSVAGPPIPKRTG